MIISTLLFPKTLKRISDKIKTIFSNFIVLYIYNDFSVI